MSWNNLSMNIQTLEADTVNKVYENVLYLKTALENAGYTVGSITNPSASYSTPIYQVRAKLQTVEDDVGQINAVDGIQSLYYDSTKTIASTFTLADYQRWLSILYDLYDIVINGSGIWYQMTLTQEENNPDVQFNGIDVYLRGDGIG